MNCVCYYKKRTKKNKLFNVYTKSFLKTKKNIQMLYDFIVVIFFHTYAAESDWISDVIWTNRLNEYITTTLKTKLNLNINEIKILNISSKMCVCYNIWCQIETNTKRIGWMWPPFDPLKNIFDHYYFFNMHTKKNPWLWNGYTECVTNEPWKKNGLKNRKI